MEQTPHANREAWVPTVPGGIGMSWYRAHVFAESNLPSLLCTPSMRTPRIIISCQSDRLYHPVPDTKDESYRYDLVFDGAHYLWPTDCCGEDDVASVRVRIQETVVPPTASSSSGPEWVIPEETREGGTGSA